MLYFQVIQTLVVLVLSPLISGIMTKARAMVQSKRGPSIFQPYYDMWKFMRKEVVAPSSVSIIFHLAPAVAFSCYIILSMVLPIVTGYPLPFAPIVDFLGGAFLFVMASVISVIAVTRTGSFYTTIGASRAISFAALAEPTLIIVFFGVALITSTNNPFITTQVLSTQVNWILSPTHLLIIVSFFMLLLFETGKIPIEAEGLMELGMLDEAKLMEYSGIQYAMLKWGSYMKQFIFMSIFLNIFTFPWGVAMGYSAVSIGIGIVSLIVKMLFLIGVLVVVEETFAKLRLFKILDYLAISFSLALLSIISFFLFGGIAL